jgi:ADP-heptose:LPS heptosyltransferase
VERLLALTASLGAPRAGRGLEFPVTAADRDRWARLAAERGVPGGGYVCVHPGARWPSRRWPAERFAAVADALAGRGLAVVLTGSIGERPLTAATARLMRAPAVDLAGLTSLGTLAAGLRGASLLVCNDTGVSHLAAALGVRSVVVASGSDVSRWAPGDRARHRVLSVDVDCRPCGYVECPIGHPCAARLPAERVAREAQEALAS